MKKGKEEKKGKEALKEAFITPNNKIYNASHSNKAGSEGAGKGGEMRPRSSNTDKYQKSIEMHGMNQEQVKQQ